MLKILFFAIIFLSIPLMASEPVQDPNINYLIDKTKIVNCSKFSGLVKQNCELTTTILSTTYSEYCTTTNCNDAKIEDMLAWLELKKSIITNIKSNK